ncbi:hypothetical protein ACFVWG_13410 [Kribbella sp. NPDC058245]|uniref:hypothetical protein n=1 Tax=Kribbella sp. NPDC058245 TaxID=3346399 RepID=UPI0036EB9FCF
MADILGNLFGSSFLKAGAGDMDRVFEEWIRTPAGLKLTNRPRSEEPSCPTCNA